MYNPVINQIGPMLVERGFSGAADSRLAGDAAMAQGISSAGQSIGNAVAGAASKWQQEAKQADTNAGVLSSYHALNEQAKKDTGKGIMPDSFFEALAATKNKNEQSGMLMAAAPNFDSFLSEQRQMNYLDKQTKSSANLAVLKASLPDTGNPQKIIAEDGIYTLGRDGIAHPVVTANGKQLQGKVSTDPLSMLFGGGAGGAVNPSGAGAAPQAGASTGGYIPGKKYGNMTFKGGNPNDPANWE